MCFVLKKSPFWDNSQENTCAFCQHAGLLANKEQVICRKRKNLYAADHTCRKFRFDILKKDVRRQKMPDFGRFSKEQFQL